MCLVSFLRSYIFLIILIIYYHLRHQKHKNKRLENNFKTNSISINNMDKSEKKHKQRREHLQKILGMISSIG